MVVGREVVVAIDPVVTGDPVVAVVAGDSGEELVGVELIVVVADPGPQAAASAVSRQPAMRVEGRLTSSSVSLRYRFAGSQSKGMHWAQ